MLLMIICCASGFSQVMSLTGASREMVMAITGAVHSEAAVLFIMFFIVFLLGLFIEQASIMMICLPLFMPLVQAYEINEIWFAVCFLILLEVGQFTPPVGHVAVHHEECVAARRDDEPHHPGAWPFVAIDLLAVLILVFIPVLVTFIPNMM